ncbi:hypothetical protein GCM10022217_25020 [Chryseobacterium ginsenosidimutans]|uniref:enoyl-CoA hydratase/isomerase family protein n=1 Tax=Chryseobacterium ginsenosidimutans TaxID=687846 RepID=UPI0031DBDF8F
MIKEERDTLSPRHLLSGDDFSAETAANYGWINRAFPDYELDTFAENLANRIASFDKNIITTITSVINERVVIPKNEDIMKTQTLFFEALGKPEAEDRIKNLMAKGVQTYGDVELNLAKYL